jgi:purine-nucleoside phosphorylase
METSALYTVAAFNRIKICNVAVVSDELWAEWRPGFHLPTFRSAQHAASGVVIGIARELASINSAPDEAA